MANRPTRARAAPTRLIDEGSVKKKETLVTSAAPKRKAALQENKTQSRSTNVSKARGLPTTPTKAQPTPKPKKGAKGKKKAKAKAKAKPKAKAAAQQKDDKEEDEAEDEAEDEGEDDDDDDEVVDDEGEDDDEEEESKEEPKAQAKAQPKAKAKAKAKAEPKPKPKATGRTTNNSQSTSTDPPPTTTTTTTTNGTTKGRGKKAAAAPSTRTPRKMLSAEQKEALEKATIDELKDRLKANDQIVTGSRPQLVERITDCLLNGCLPRCPKCFRGRLKLRETGNYFCPGAFDDDVFKKCSYKTKTPPDRPAWKKKDPSAHF